MLCTHHNSALSPYDNEDGTLKAAMCAMEDACGNPNAVVETFEIDGDLIERCLLKTLCGGLSSGNFLVPPGSKLKGEEPPREWLEILYKGAEFQKPRGLYLLQTKPGEILRTTESQLTLVPLFSLDESICGLRMLLFGFPFILLLTDIAPGVRTEFDDALYRPRGIEIVGCNKRLSFRWKHGSQSDALTMHFLNRTEVHLA